MTQCHALFFYAAVGRPSLQPNARADLHGARLHHLYTHPGNFFPSFTHILLLLHLSKTPFEEGIEMDLVYLGGLVVFTALTLALIVGFDKLRRGPGGRP
jgi:hypothetical protein